MAECMANDTAEQCSSRTDTWAVLLAHPAFNRELSLTCKLLCVSKCMQRTLAVHSTGIHVCIQAHPAAQKHQQLSRKLEQFARWLRANGALLQSLDWEVPGPDSGTLLRPTPSLMELADILAAGVVGAAVRQQQLQPLRLAAYSGLHDFDEATGVLRCLPQLTSVALHIRPHPHGAPPHPAVVQNLITTLASLQALRSLDLHDARSEFGVMRLPLGKLFEDVQPLSLDCLLRSVQPLSQLTRLAIGHLGNPIYTVGHLTDPVSLAYLPSRLAELSCGLRTEAAIDLSHITGLKVLHLPAVCLSAGSVLPQGLHEVYLWQLYSCGPLLGLKHLRKLHVSDVTDKTPEVELLRLRGLTGQCDVAVHYKQVAIFMQHAAAGVLQVLPVRGLDFEVMLAERLMAPMMDIVSQLTGLTKLTIYENCQPQQCHTPASSMRAVLQQLSKLRGLRFSAWDCHNLDVIRSVIFQALPTLTNLEDFSCTAAKLGPRTEPAEIISSDAGAETVLTRGEQLQCLSHATGLTSLRLAESDITHVELASLAASLTALKALEIMHMVHLDDGSLHSIAAFTGLTRLWMFGCSLSDTGAQRLTVLQHLKEFRW